MVDIQVAHTADLDRATLAAGRALLYDVFDDMTDDDWEHSCGGMHALAWADGQLVGHAALVQRRLMHAGRAMRTGYVEGVGVRADLRGRGVGSALMAELERIIAAAYDVGALGSTDEAMPFYRARGWVAWRGTASAMTPDGVIATPDELGWIFVLPGVGPQAVPLDLDGDLMCDWRDGEVW